VSWKGLRHKGVERLTSREWNTVIDCLDELYGYVTSGQQDINVNKVSAKTGEFSETLTVQGKTVLKDGDPIHIASFFDEAKSQITQAIDSSKVSDILSKQDSIIDKLTSIINVVEVLKHVRGTPSKDLDNYVLDPGGIVEVVKGDLDGWVGLAVTVRATYSTDASNGVRVRWLFSPDGSNFDTPEDAEVEGNYVDLTFSPGVIRQRTIMFTITTPYVKIQVVNLDTSYSVTVSMWVTPLR